MPLVDECDTTPLPELLTLAPNNIFFKLFLESHLHDKAFVKSKILNLSWQEICQLLSYSLEDKNHLLKNEINQIFSDSKFYSIWKEKLKNNGLLSSYEYSVWINPADYYVCYQGLKEIKNQPSALENLPTSYKNYQMIVHRAMKINGLALAYASEALRNNALIVDIAVRGNGLALCFASEDLKDSFEIALNAYLNHQTAFFLASPRVRQMLETMKEVKENGLILESADKKLKNMHWLVLDAVKQNGLALEYASGRLQDNLSIVVHAVIQNTKALQFASEALQKQESLQTLVKIIEPQKRQQTGDKILNPFADIQFFSSSQSSTSNNEPTSNDLPIEETLSSPMPEIKSW